MQKEHNNIDDLFRSELSDHVVKAPDFIKTRLAKSVFGKTCPFGQFLYGYDGNGNPKCQTCRVCVGHADKNEPRQRGICRTFSSDNAQWTHFTFTGDVDGNDRLYLMVQCW